MTIVAIVARDQSRKLNAASQTSDEWILKANHQKERLTLENVILL